MISLIDAKLKGLIPFRQKIDELSFRSHKRWTCKNFLYAHASLPNCLHQVKLQRSEKTILWGLSNWELNILCNWCNYIILWRKLASLPVYLTVNIHGSFLLVSTLFFRTKSKQLWALLARGKLFSYPADSSSLLKIFLFEICTNSVEQHRAELLCAVHALWHIKNLFLTLAGLHLLCSSTSH